jgi:hypothetical protein
MFNFLSSCAGKLNVSGKIRKVMNTSSLLPWVRIWTTDSQEEKGISVGNYSSATTSASIKSFQYGISNGCGVSFEIVDEFGGEFSNFISKISRGNLDSLSKNVLNFRFGWASAACAASGPFSFETASTAGQLTFSPAQKTETPNFSSVHTMILRNITCDISGGQFRYSIDASDPSYDNFTTKPTIVIGTELPSGKKYLVEAISELLDQIGVIADFRSIRNGFPEMLQFEVNGIDIDPFLGPLGSWKVNGLSPIAACQNWINGFCSDAGRGIITYFEDGFPKPTLVFQEAVKPKCGENANLNSLNLGTFIIGAPDSPVISFSPQIKYNLNYITTGTVAIQGSSTQPFVVKPDGVQSCGPPTSINQGLNTAITISDNESAIFRAAAGPIKALNSQRNQFATMFAPPFEAEMQIQGDPSFDRPIYCNGHNVSVVFPNPFTVVGFGRNCEWTSLAKPDCNRDLSSAYYTIKGVSHEIKEGYFRTTLKLHKAFNDYSI